MSETNDTFWDLVTPLEVAFKASMRKEAGADKAVKNVGRVLLGGEKIGPNVEANLNIRLWELYGIDAEEVDHVLSLAMLDSLENDRRLQKAEEAYSHGR